MGANSQRTTRGLRRTMLLVACLGVALATAPWAAAGNHANTPGGDAGNQPDDAGKPEGVGNDGVGGKPDFAKVQDKWLLRNEHVSVWFLQAGASGKAKPFLKVFATGEDGNETGYSILINRLCEIPENETYCHGDGNWVNLERAQEWDLNVTETNATLTIDMRLMTDQGLVGLIWHLPKDAPEVKFDLVVEDWAWAEDHAGHRLGLEMMVETTGGDLAADAADGNITTPGGWVSWADSAQATYGENDTRTLNVTHVAVGPNGNPPGGNATDGNASAQLESPGRLLLVFEGEAGYQRLLYDPSLGAGEPGTAGDGTGDGGNGEGQDLAGVPGPGLLIAAGAIAAAGLVARRRNAR